MKELHFTIKSVSEIFHIPAHTLRYWQTMKLFNIPQGKNAYRTYSLRDLFNIANVIFWRNLGVPVKEIPKLEAQEYTYSKKYLDKSLQQIEARMEEYEIIKHRILEKKNQLEKLVNAEQNRFQTEDIPFSEIVPFNLADEKRLRQYAFNPSAYVRYYDSINMKTEIRACISVSDESSSVIWRKVPGRKFLTFLIREKVEENYKSDVLTTLRELPSELKTGVLLAEYLVTATENGEKIDYYKAYLELC